MSIIYIIVGVAVGFLVVLVVGYQILAYSILNKSEEGAALDEAQKIKCAESIEKGEAPSKKCKSYLKKGFCPDDSCQTKVK